MQNVAVIALATIYIDDLSTATLSSLIATWQGAQRLMSATREINWTVSEFSCFY